MKIKPKRYIVWSTDEIDLDDPWQRKRYIEDVLTHGKTEDIIELDLAEVRKLQPELDVPKEVRRLWNDFFAGQPAENPAAKGIASPVQKQLVEFFFKIPDSRAKSARKKSKIHPRPRASDYPGSCSKIA